MSPFRCSATLKHAGYCEVSKRISEETQEHTTMSHLAYGSLTNPLRGAGGGSYTEKGVSLLWAPVVYHH